MRESIFSTTELLTTASRGLGILWLSVLALSLGCSYGMAQEPVKIFSLQRPDSDPQAAIPELNDPLVYGLSWRFRWQTIEPQEAHYNWEPIDTAIAITGKASKQVMLRIVAGMHTPDWVYHAGAEPVDFRNTDLAHPQNYPISARMPRPWDDIYLAKWEAFIQTLGQRYSGNPHLYSIQMSGGGHIGEMNLPKAFTVWRQAGYTDAKLIAAWKRIIDAYQLAFPETPTNLAINEPLRRKHSDVMQPVVAYVLSTYPHKVYLQHNGLKAVFPQESRIRRLLRQAASETRIGYQMVGGTGFLDTQTGDRFTAFQHALEDHASYVEVYAQDVRHPGLRQALHVLASSPR